MHSLLITTDAVSELDSIPSSLPDQGFLWLDVVRDGEQDWSQVVERLTGVSIHERHLKDTQNLSHPSFYDGTQIFDHLLVTIRPEDSVSVSKVKPRLLNKSVRIPRRPAGLMHLLMTYMVDRYLALRDPLIQRFDTWRQDLLDPRNPFSDYMSVLDYTSDLRKLERLCDEQIQALASWQEETDTEFDDHLAVRYRDLNEHIQRVKIFAGAQKQDAEALVQMHFSAVAHRTNEIVRVLTVLSAIFLPLSLVAGIFGMNFEYMPELKMHFAYFFALGGMVTLAVVLLVLFKIKRWI
ncbi:MAG: magnesium transporter CorA family protein [Gammaproteobacteria bacterium]